MPRSRLVFGGFVVLALVLLGAGPANGGGARAPTTGLTVSRFRLAGPPVALTVAGGSVWVVEETAGRLAVLVRIEPVTGRRLTGFEIGQAGPDFGAATSTGSVVWAAAGNHVIRVDARRPDAVRRAVLPGEAAGVAVAAGSVWVSTVGAGDTVSRLDARTLARQHRLELTMQPVALRAGLGSVWLASTSGLWRIEPATDKLLPAASPVAQPVAVTVTGARVWVAGQDGHLSAVGATGGLRRRLELPFSPDALTATPNRLWVTSNCGCRTGKLALLNSRSGRLLAERAIGETPVALASDRGGVWVATFADERISHVRPS